jgi:DNA-binding NarL/FixJ family response regulator
MIDRMELTAGDPAPPIRVLVVDADDRVRESLGGLLGIGQRCVVVGTAGRPDAALELAASMRPDVVVIDPRLPEVDGGIALIMRLRELVPGVRVLVMGWSESLEHLELARQADVFIRKTFRAAGLVEAVAAAYRAPEVAEPPGSRPC